MSRLETRLYTPAEATPVRPGTLDLPPDPRVPAIVSYPRISRGEVHTLGIVEHGHIRHVAELRWTCRIVDGQLDEIHPEPMFDGPGRVVRKAEAQQEAWDYAEENSDELIANAREG